MKKIRPFFNGLVFATLLSIFTCLPALANEAVTIYSDNNYAPYSFVENGKPAGIYVDIFNKAFSLMDGYTVTIKPVPWKRGVNLMKEGKGFALFPPYYRPQKRPFMDYPVPVLDEGYSVITSQDFAGSGDKKWPEDYAGKKVGINSGFSVPDVEKARSLNVKIEEAASTRSNLMKLISGRMDAYIIDKNAGFWGLKQLKNAGEYDAAKHGTLAVATDISREQGYMGFTNRDKGRFAFRDDFIKKFVAAINQMKADGEIQAILDSYVK